MNRWLSLYPRAWRRRYGAELESLLADRPPTPSDLIDLVRGALDAHLHPELVEGDIVVRPMSDVPAADLRTARRLGFATLAGGAAWLLAWFVASLGPIVQDGATSYRDGQAAFPILFLASWLLVGGAIGQLIVLPKSARLARLGAIIATFGWIFLPFGPWILALEVTAFAGLAILAIGALTAGQWPWLASAALLAGIVAIPIIYYTTESAARVGAELTPAMAAFLVSVLVTWLTVGGTLATLRAEDAPLAV